MIDPPRASIALTELGIPHQVFRHSAEVTSLEQAARERGQRPEQVVRSIVFRATAGHFVMALVAGPTQVSWKRLRTHLGQSRLTMASEAEVLQATGYRIGTVSPFGFRPPMRILIDAGVLRETQMSIGSGVSRTAIIMTTADLLLALPDAEITKLVDDA